MDGLNDINNINPKIMRKYLLLVIWLFLTQHHLIAKITPANLTCEYLKNPMVIDVINPRLSWINIAEVGERGQVQSAWEIRIAGSKELLLSGKADLWNSGKITSGESVNIRYGGKALASRQDCWWQVRVWDKNGKVSEWSEPAFWSMGLLDPQEWKAKWIGAPWQGEEPIPDRERPLTASRAKPGQTVTDIYNLNSPPPAPMLRKSFSVRKDFVAAKAYVTGLGYFELYLNGKKVGHEVLVPNQTNYGKRPGLMINAIPIPDNFKEYRVMYLSYDLKDLLTEGENVVGTIVGNGFYNAPINWTESYGTPRFLGQIHLTYADGTEDVIISDETWKVAKSPVIMDLIFDGEHYDARLEQPGWCNKGFDDSRWLNAVIRKAPEGRMKAHMAYPDRVMEILDPVKIEKLGEGQYKVDFGQEISGWIHLKDITGDPGRKIDIRYLHQTPSGDNSYTLKGIGQESYSARFTWFVFREVEISNWPGDLKPEQIQAEAVYTFVETTGKFECSDPLLNDINRIWWRSQTDNMHGGIASDCPNRERSPYTGDGQVSCVTVMHNFDARAFYNKWVHDIIGACNEETGYVPNGAPWQPGCGGGVAWGAAISIMPWEFYLHYGDENILKESYEGMKGYVRYMLTWTDADGIMFSQVLSPSGKPNRWMNLGDWSQPYELPPDNMVHTFYLWRCADITSNVASILGNKDEAEKFAAIAEKIRLAFMKRFYDEKNGTYGKYGGNIFALRMGVPEDRKVKVIAALEADIQANGGHLDTGIFGTQFFFEILAENGLNELAYEAMKKRTMPSYGYWLEQGATTSWEGWDNPGSGNHPMFGGGLVWLYRKLAGMNTDHERPGYKHVIFHPRLAGDITYASYSNLTPYGHCAISWRKEYNKFSMNVSVPVGSTATVYVPSERQKYVLESGKKIRSRSGVSFIRMENGFAVFNVGSGEYVFENYIIK
jgi:alpha-L-rhamnosidase